MSRRARRRHVTTQYRDSLRRRYPAHRHGRRWLGADCDGTLELWIEQPTLHPFYRCDTCGEWHYPASAATAGEKA